MAIKSISPFKFIFIICLSTVAIHIHAQIKINPLTNIGSGYASITQGGLDYEDPDCVHKTFGPHITIEVDSLLKKPVFLFHSHINEDNDRCITFDRVRMEIKGGPGTNPESQHLINTKSFYRWKFFIPHSFVGSSDFNHIFQNKIFGGEDTDLPLITFTLRSNVLQIIHSGGKTGASSGTLAQVPLSSLLGKWVEAYMYQEHGTTGKIQVTLVSVIDGAVLLDFYKDNLLLWRTGAEYSRPKWGIYRKKNAGLKDETILFSDFCISEVSKDLCPSSITTVINQKQDTISKIFPHHGATQISIKPTLQWDTIKNSSFTILLDSNPNNLKVEHITNNNYYMPKNLKPKTTYYWSIVTKNGNGQTFSSPISSFTTGDTSIIKSSAWLVYAANDLPHVESKPWMELNARPTKPLKDEVIIDPLLPGNKLYVFHSDERTNFRYRYRQNPLDTAMTIVMRTKAINNEINTFNYLEIRSKGFREKMRLNTSTVKIERSITETEKPWPRDPKTNFHVVRMTLKGQVCKVYIDEDPDPFLTGKTETLDANSFIEWGKSATQEVGGIVDYIAIYPNIEASPNHLPLLPDSLVLSSDATLKEITINGTSIQNFNPKVFNYTINFDSEDTEQIIDFKPNSRYSDIEISKSTKSVDSIITIDVVAQDKINNSKYTINLKKITTSNNVIDDIKVKIYPVPFTSTLNIDFKDNIDGKLFLYNSIGQLVALKPFSQNTKLNTVSLPTGNYHIVFKTSNGLSFSKVIYKQ